MFSKETAYKPKISLIPDIEAISEYYLNLFCKKTNLCGGFLCSYDEKVDDFSIISTVNIPAAPFIGSDKNLLTSVLKDCFKKYPKPHIHSVGVAFWDKLSSFVDIGTWHPSIIYLPLYARDKSFVFIGFYSKSEKIEMTEEFMEEVSELIDTISFVLAAEETTKHLKIMEFYVKEIGHDIASSVQAIIAKLRTVSKKSYEGQMAIDKIKEAEDEIMAAYRIADTLGITVDPDYNIQSGNDFDIIETINNVIQLCRSEANERHIELRFYYPQHQIIIWGDEKAIQSAITQLLINAIKYGRGASFIKINVKEINETIEISITDLGLPIEEEEKALIWDFGFRGKKSKEYHVNGSGIGLYTVKKITEAHGGSVDVQSQGDSQKLITFYMKLPKRDLLKKSKLL
jgi:signal transduction histidine kinase